MSSVTIKPIMLSVIMLSVVYANRRYGECLYAECHCNECRGVSSNIASLMSECLNRATYSFIN
jgi:hypothetical protein